MTPYDVLGLFGVALILISYFMLQIGKLHLEQVLYSLLNLIGALFILVSLLFSWNLASFIIEVAWILISLYGIIKSLKRRFS
jgi:hypothetical protein